MMPEPDPDAAVSRHRHAAHLGSGDLLAGAPPPPWMPGSGAWSGWCSGCGMVILLELTLLSRSGPRGRPGGRATAVDLPPRGDTGSPRGREVVNKEEA